MRLSTIAAVGVFSTAALAEYCRYRIRSYGNPDCSGNAFNDRYLSSTSCFDLAGGEYIWINSVDGTDYCTHGNWIREYANFLHPGSCSNNNRGEQYVEMQRCEHLQHYWNGAIGSDSIRINYA